MPMKGITADDVKKFQQAMEQLGGKVDAKIYRTRDTRLKIPTISRGPR